MEKYYLLTFEQDWADEHDVPALECMTEEGYEKWLNSASGKINPKYAEQKEAWDAHDAKQKAFWQGMSDRNLSNKQFTSYTKEEKEWYDKNKIDYMSSRNYPRRVKSYIHAFLGNGGEGFGENFEDLVLMRDFVDQGYVQVYEVDKSFYDMFHKAGLNGLSLCNVFQDKRDWGYDEDDDE